MSLLETCKACGEIKVLSEYHGFWYKGGLYTRKVCKICYRKQQNLDNLRKRIRKESEQIARQYRRNLIKIAIKVLIGLLIVGGIVAVTAKGA